MDTIRIYKNEQGKDTFTGAKDQKPCAIVTCDREHALDAQTDRLIVPSVKHDPEFRASTVVLAARNNVFGFKFVEEYQATGAAPPEAKPRRGKGQTK